MSSRVEAVLLGPTAASVEDHMSTSPRIVRIAAVSAVGALGALLPLSAAGAYPNPPNPPDVAPSNLNRTQTAPTEVSPNRVSRASTLPFTGADIAELAAIGGATAGVGFVLVRRSRRVRATG
jgi:hypothetical protein